MLRTVLISVVLVGAVIAAGCARKSCLRGDCDAVSACDQVEFTCEPTGVLYAGRVDQADPAMRLSHGEAADGDFLMTNGTVTVVIDALDEPHDLAPTGGNVIDFGRAGGADDVNLVYQIAGILPDDAFAYDTLELEDASADLVAIVARGHLDGRPEIQ